MIDIDDNNVNTEVTINSYLSTCLLS